MPKIIQRKDKRCLKGIGRCEVCSQNTPKQSPTTMTYVRRLRHLLTQSRNDGKLRTRHYRSIILFSEYDY